MKDLARWLTILFHSIFAAFLVTICLFAVLGFFTRDSGAELMRDYSRWFFGVWCTAFGFYILMWGKGHPLK
jgi:cadmium resistance protein CadD (predicted permease)